MNPTLAELTGLIRAARLNAPAADLPPSLAAPLQFGGVRVVTSNYAKAGAVTPTFGATPGIVSGGRSSVYTRGTGWRKGAR